VASPPSRPMLYESSCLLMGRGPDLTKSVGRNGIAFRGVCCADSEGTSGGRSGKVEVDYQIGRDQKAQAMEALASLRGNGHFPMMTQHGPIGFQLNDPTVSLQGCHGCHESRRARQHAELHFHGCSPQLLRACYPLFMTPRPW